MALATTMKSPDPGWPSSLRPPASSRPDSCHPHPAPHVPSMQPQQNTYFPPHAGERTVRWGSHWGSHSVASSARPAPARQLSSPSPAPGLGVRRPECPAPLRKVLGHGRRRRQRRWDLFICLLRRCIYFCFHFTLHLSHCFAGLCASWVPSRSSSAPHLPLTT